MDSRDEKAMNKNAQENDNIDGIIISSTNSEVGSYHWFHTLAARIKHTSEFQMNNGADGNFDIKNQGKRIYDSIQELLDGYDAI